MNLIHLKSGTDVRGTAISTEEHPEFELTDEVVSAISGAFIDFLNVNLRKPINELTVSVGHDSRISAMRIKDAVIKKLTDMGVNVLYCSYCSTPAMFMTTVTKGCDGAVQITASHHPYDRNGLKFLPATADFRERKLQEFSAGESLKDRALKLPKKVLLPKSTIFPNIPTS